MTDHDPEFLDEAEAARLWQRVAQRQAEAARKAEAISEDPDADGTQKRLVAALE